MYAEDTELETSFSIRHSAFSIMLIQGLNAHVRLLTGLPAGAVAVSKAGRGLRLVAVLARSALLLPDGLLLGSVLRLRMRGHLRLRLSQHLDLQRLHSHTWSESLIAK